VLFSLASSPQSKKFLGMAGLALCPRVVSSRPNLVTFLFLDPLVPPGIAFVIVVLGVIVGQVWLWWAICPTSKFFPEGFGPPLFSGPVLTSQVFLCLLPPYSFLCYVGVFLQRPAITRCAKPTSVVMSPIFVLTHRHRISLTRTLASVFSFKEFLAPLLLLTPLRHPQSTAEICSDACTELSESCPRLRLSATLFSSLPRLFSGVGLSPPARPTYDTPTWCDDDFPPMKLGLLEKVRSLLP